MRNIHKNIKIIFFPLLFLFLGCSREGSIPEVKPLVRTNQIQLTSEGVVLSGEFILSGTYRSIHYGFHLSTDFSFNNPIVIEAGSDKQPDKFEALLYTVLDPDRKYYVRAWVKSEKYEVLGNSLEFVNKEGGKDQRAPEITKVIPETALWGDTIAITGKYFDFFGFENKVLFNGVESKIRSRHDTIWAIIPNVPAAQNRINMMVKVAEKGIEKEFVINLTPPVFTGLSKNEGQYPDTIVINGDHFTSYGTAVLVDGKEAEITNLSKKSISFVFPYLKEEKQTKIDLSRSIIFPITNDFKYHGQAILHLSKNDAWIGDTIKLYGKNIDFKRILINIKNTDPKLLSDYFAQYNQNLTVRNRWKDSLEFILKGSIDAVKFNLEVQFGKTLQEFPYKIFSTIDQKEVNHKTPVIYMEKKEYIYGETIKWTYKGMYPFFYSHGQGHIIKSTETSFAVNSSEIDEHPANRGALEPGNYSLQLNRPGTYSNIEYFKVKAPSLESVSPTPFNRDNELQISGLNLPLNYTYSFTHLQSGRIFPLYSWWPRPEQMIGSGDYQVEMKIGDKSYKYPGVVHMNDYFDYQTKLATPIAQSSSVGCGFSVNNKLYIPQQSGMMSIIDLTTGNVRSKPGYYNYDHQPVFLGDNIYMNIYKEDQRRTALCSFNKSTEEWDEVNMEGVPADFVLAGMGVFKNHLLAISKGNIYQFDQKWNFIKNIKLDLYFIHYIYSKNDKLYLCDFYKGQIAVVSTLNFEVLENIKMPGEYQNSLRYVFELQDGLYYCGLARGGGDSTYHLYKFTINESFQKLTPGNLDYDYFYHFCPDGKGNVYFITEGYIYKFNQP